MKTNIQKVIATTLLLLLAKLVISSNNKIDSLNSIIKMQENPEAQIDSSLNMARRYMMIDFETAYQLAIQALDLSENNGNAENAAKARIIIGRICLLKKNYPLVIKNFTEALKYYERKKDYSEIARLSNRLGAAYFDFNLDEEEAIKYLKQGIHYSDKCGNNDEKVYAYNTLGIHYANKKMFEEAAHYFKEGTFLIDSVKEKSKAIAAINNLGELYRLKGDLESAIKYYFMSIKMADEKTNSDLSINYINLGETYLQMGDIDNALKYFNQAKEEGSANNRTDNKIHIMNKIGDCYLAIRNYSKAIEQAQKALEEAEKYDNNEMIRDAHLLLSKTYESMGKTELALKNHKLYTQYNDSINLNEQEAKLTELRNSYTLDLKEREIELQKQKIESLQKAKKNNSVGIILLSTICSMMIITLKIHFTKFKENKKLLKENQELIKSKEKVMEEKLRLKTNSITNYALHIEENNKFLENLKVKMKGMSQSSGNDHEKQIKEILMNVQENIQMQYDIEELRNDINDTNKDFFERLDKSFPQLTKNERRLCSHLYMNLTTKEIASLSKSSIKAVEMSRYRLRKKLGIKENDNISTFLHHI